HELRNPLHSMLNIIKGIHERDENSLSNESINDLDIVQIVGRRMTVTLNDLLEAINLKEGSPTLQLRHVSLSSIATDVIDMIQHLANEKSIQLNNEVTNDIPAVYADENRLTQVMF